LDSATAPVFNLDSSTLWDEMRSTKAYDFSPQEEKDITFSHQIPKYFPAGDDYYLQITVYDSREQQLAQKYEKISIVNFADQEKYIFLNGSQTSVLGRDQLYGFQAGPTFEYNVQYEPFKDPAEPAASRQAVLINQVKAKIQLVAKAGSIKTPTIKLTSYKYGSPMKEIASQTLTNGDTYSKNNSSVLYIMLPLFEPPGAYETFVQFFDGKEKISNPLGIRYITAGNSGLLYNYNVEKIDDNNFVLNVITIGRADAYVAANIDYTAQLSFITKDSAGQNCYSKTLEVTLNKTKTIQQPFTLTNCSGPYNFELALTKDGKNLDQEAITANAPAVEQPIIPASKNNLIVVAAALLLILLGVAILLFLKLRKKSPPTITGAMILIILMAGLALTGSAKAAGVAGSSYSDHGVTYGPYQSGLSNGWPIHVFNDASDKAPSSNDYLTYFYNPEDDSYYRNDIDLSVPNFIWNKTGLLFEVPADQTTFNIDRTIAGNWSCGNESYGGGSMAFFIVDETGNLVKSFQDPLLWYVTYLEQDGGADYSFNLPISDLTKDKKYRLVLQTYELFFWDTSNPPLQSQNYVYTDFCYGDCGLPPSPPGTPTGLNATCPAPGTSGTVTWTATAGATNYWFLLDAIPFGNDVCSLPGAQEICNKNVSANSYTFPTTESGRYTAKVTACNSVGCSSSASQAVTCSFPAPNLTVTEGCQAADQAKVDLSWTTNASTVIGYDIYRSTRSGSHGNKLSVCSELSAGINTCTDTTAATSTTYYYMVRAYNDNDEFQDSAKVSKKTPSCAGATGNEAPETTLAIQNSSGALISTANVSDTVYLYVGNSTDPDGSISTVKFCSDDTPGDDTCDGSWTPEYSWTTNLGDWNATTKKISWSFATAGDKGVYAVVKDDQGLWDPTPAEDLITINVPVPISPTGVTATPASCSQVDLKWNDVNWEDGYRIERCTGSSCINFAQIVQVGANVKFYSDKGLAANTVYRYRVRAYNTAGSNVSNPAPATTLTCATPPAAPSGLSGAKGCEGANDAKVDLNWTDNSNDETGFNVYRSTTSGFTPSGSYLITASPLAANAESYTDSSAAISTLYYYIVRSVNAGGESANSNEAMVLTANCSIATYSVILNPPSIYVGDTTHATAYYDPDGAGPQPRQDVTDVSDWTSANPLKAIIDNGSHKGLITGVSPGSSQITATYLDNSGSATVTVDFKPLWREIIPW
jgi:hypothetical protein